MMLLAVAAAGCDTLIPLAPGAENVKITRNAMDVANCRAVGNLDHVKVDIFTDAPQRMVRNQAIGLGGDTVFDTSSPLATEVTGIVYRCGESAGLPAK